MCSSDLILHDPIPLPSQVADDFVLIPEALDDICMKALARDRDERFATAHEMRERLRELMPSLDPRQRARERLVELTRRVLPHRFAETEALMRRAIHDDSGETEAPEEPSWLTGPAAIEARAAEAGLELDVSVSTPEPDPHAEQLASRLLRRRATRRAWTAAVVVLAVCATAAGVLSLVLGDGPSTSAAELARGERPIAAAAPGAEPAQRAPSGSPEARAGGAAGSGSTRVHLRVESTPEGAQVSIDGDVVGTTPLDHVVERSSTPRRVTIEREGLTPFTGEITPETDQRLVVRLTAVRATPRRVRPRFYSFD